jgi:hypothetical protein
MTIAISKVGQKNKKIRFEIHRLKVRNINTTAAHDNSI